MQTFNKGKFGQLKRSIAASGKALRKNVQAIIEQGLSHYLETGDTVYLNQAMSVAIVSKSIRTVAMQAYIQAVANVHWTEVKMKAGKIRVFKKNINEDGTKPEAIVDTLLVETTPWFDYVPEAGQDKPDMDFNAQLKSLITRTKSAISNGTIDDKVAAEAGLVVLEGLLKAA